MLSFLAGLPSGLDRDRFSSSSSPERIRIWDFDVSIEWKGGAQFSSMRVIDHLNGETIAITSPFTLTLSDGSTLSLSNLRMIGRPKAFKIAPNPSASRLAERKPRSGWDATFVDQNGRLQVEWRLIQVEGAPYLRSEVTTTALKQDEAIKSIDLFDALAPGAEVVGRVDGSPVVAGHVYFQFENPLSKSSTGVNKPIVRLWIERALPLRTGKSVTYSAAVGTTSNGQLRRDFQSYLEDQRAHPYRTFLHYNSWYDLGYFTPYTADQAVARIETFLRSFPTSPAVKLIASC